MVSGRELVDDLEFCTGGHPLPNLSPDELRRNLEALYTYRMQNLTGDEKGEAQIFCERLFQAFGHEGLREAGATLEQRVKKLDSKGTAFADLMWKPRVLIEFKKAGQDLSRHFRQAFDYWMVAVPNRPRYVILCNFDEFWIYDFENQIEEPVDKVLLKDLAQRSNVLGFMHPVDTEPVFQNDLVAVTRVAAGKVAKVFRSLHDRGIDRNAAQRFCLQSVMAMFAEDIGLMPQDAYSKLLREAKSGVDAYDTIFGLFREMNTPGNTPGGRFKGTPYFNGGLFADIIPLELTDEELDLMRAAASERWSDVRPEIFGTLFEGSMEDGERHASGAHFTSPADIAKVVIPTIVTPWRERLDAAKGSIEALEKELFALSNFRVLDPACGSGNFLYVAYRELRRLEKEAHDLIADRRRSGALAAQSLASFVSTDHFYGFDINPFAVEIAKVTMMLAKKLSSDELHDTPEVLPLENLDGSIKTADALFTVWPKADAIIGNPPYLGRRKMVKDLGAVYTNKVTQAHPKVAGVADFVCYWFPLAHDRLEPGGRAGFVATNTIRQNASRESSLGYIVDNGGIITDAVSSEPWSGEAGVSVSIVNWVKDGQGVKVPETKVLWLEEGNVRLELPEVTPSLSPEIDLRKSHSLAVNKKPKVFFQGQTPGVTDGYIIKESDRKVAQKLMIDSAPVVHPFLGGDEILHELGPDRWVVDIDEPDSIKADAKYPSAMAHLRELVLPLKEARAKEEADRNNEVLAANPKARVNRHHEGFLNSWWQLNYRRADMLDAVAPLDRYIAVTRVASDKRLSIFTYVDPSIWLGDSAQAFAFDDDYSMGILQSTLHRQWLVERCSTLETRLRYTSTTVFDSFAWPQNPTAVAVERVARAMAAIVELREGYLNSGITLAKQYNSLRTAGKSKLKDLHDELDAAVYEAFEFSTAIDPIAQMFSLNQEVHELGKEARGPGAAGLQNTRFSNYKLVSTL
jgi:hypothetical protein